MCTLETSVSISNLCGTAVIDLVKPCHRRSCVVKWLPQGISTSGQRLFPSEPEHTKSHLQQHTWSHQRAQGAMGRHLPEEQGETCVEPGAFLAPAAGERRLGYTMDSLIQ